MILGYASELEENPALPGAARDQAAVIRRQSEKLTGLVADLNLTTKLEYALRPLEVKQLDPVELARQAVSEVLNSGLADVYTLTFTEAAPGARMTVEGDPALLSRMLANLLHNSVDHNPGGCGIEVMVGPAATGGCVFTVADSGVGGEHGQAAHPQPGCAGGQHPGRRPGKRGRARAGPADRAADRPRPPRPPDLCRRGAPRPDRAGVDRREGVSPRA